MTPVDASERGRYSSIVPSHMTLAGDELVYPEPPPELAAYLARVKEAAADPAIGIPAMTSLVYSHDNPLLEELSRETVPCRGAAGAAAWASPVWHVMLDLLELKRVVVIENTPSLRLDEVGELLDMTVEGARQAIRHERLDGEKRGHLWYATPASVASYRDRVTRRGPRRATSLVVRCGSKPGYSFHVKAAESSSTKVKRGVTDVTIPDFQRVLLRLQWKEPDGGKSRRVLVLEPDPASEPTEYRWPPVEGGDVFFVTGRFRIAQKINNAADAAAAWKEIEPA